MYVYLLRSKLFPNQTYIGITHNLKNRLPAHNAGRYIHTSKFKPWKIITVTWLDEIGFVFTRFEESLIAVTTPKVVGFLTLV